MTITLMLSCVIQYGATFYLLLGLMQIGYAAETLPQKDWSTRNRLVWRLQSWWEHRAFSSSLHKTIWSSDSAKTSVYDQHLGLSGAGTFPYLHCRVCKKKRNQNLIKQLQTCGISAEWSTKASLWKSLSDSIISTNFQDDLSNSRNYSPSTDVNWYDGPWYADE